MKARSALLGLERFMESQRQTQEAGLARLRESGKVAFICFSLKQTKLSL